MWLGSCSSGLVPRFGCQLGSHTSTCTYTQNQQQNSDFPYVTTLGGGYVEAPRAVLAWKEQGLLPSFTDEDYANLFSDTFVRVFGE